MSAWIPVIIGRLTFEWSRRRHMLGEEQAVEVRRKLQRRLEGAKGALRVDPTHETRRARSLEPAGGAVARQPTEIEEERLARRAIQNILIGVRTGRAKGHVRL